MNSELSVNKDSNAAFISIFCSYKANVREHSVCFQGRRPKTRLRFCFAAGFRASLFIFVILLCVCVFFFSFTESLPNTLSPWRVNLIGGFRPRFSPPLGSISRTPLVEVTSRAERWWTAGRDKLVGKFMISALFFVCFFEPRKFSCYT